MVYSWSTAALMLSRCTGFDGEHSLMEVRVACCSQRLWRLTYEPSLILFLAAIIIQSLVLHQYLYYRAAVDLGLDYYVKSSSLNNTKDAICLQEKLNSSMTLQTGSREMLLQQNASSYIVKATVSYTFPAILSSLLLGVLSDKRGRKLTMLLPVIGSVVQASLILLTVYFHLPVFIIYIGCGVAGLSGYYTTMILSCLAYISDVTPQGDRAIRMGVMEAITFASGLLGQVMSGTWIDHSGYQSPFLVILLLHVVNILYLCQLMESLPLDLKNDKYVPNLESIKTVLRALTVHRRCKRWRLSLTLGVSILSLFTGSTISIMAVLFMKNFPLCWTATLIGYFFGFKSTIKAVSTVGGIKGFRYLGWSDYTIAQIGLLFQTTGLIFAAFARTTLWMFLVPVVGVLCGIAVPCIRAQISSMVGRHEQGSIFAIIASTESLASFSANTALNVVYSWSLSLSWRYAAGFVFLMNAVITLVPLLLIRRAPKSHVQWP